MLSQVINSRSNRETPNQQNQSENFIFLQESYTISSFSSSSSSSFSSSKIDRRSSIPWQEYQHSWSKSEHRHWHPEQGKHESLFSMVENQYNQGKSSLAHLVIKLLPPNLRKSMNFLYTLLILALLNHLPGALAANPTSTEEINSLTPENSNNLIKNPFNFNNIKSNTINNVYDKEIATNLGNLDNLEDDFSLSSLNHPRPVILSPSSSSLSSSPKLPVSSEALLSQSKSYLQPSTTTTTSSQQLPSSSSSSFSLSSSSSSIESTSSPVSPGSHYSFISSSHHPNQLSHYYLQINKPQPQQSSPSTPTTTQQSTNNNNEAIEMAIKTPKDFESLFHRIARRSSRPYDVPQIECPVSEDGVDRFACPTPNKEGRYRCIEDHELCNGFIACPNAEDEDRKLCMFYKTTKAHLDVLADAMLRMVRGRF